MFVTSCRPSHHLPVLFWTKSSPLAAFTPGACCKSKVINLAFGVKGAAEMGWSLSLIRDFKFDKKNVCQKLSVSKNDEKL